MSKSKQTFIEMREQDINDNLHEGVNMYFTAPKEEPIDYSLNDFEGLVKHHSKFKPDVKKVILDAITEYKRLMDQF